MLKDGKEFFAFFRIIGAFLVPFFNIKVSGGKLPSMTAAFSVIN